MKNLIELSHEEMKTINGGDKWWRDLAKGVGYILSVLKHADYSGDVPEYGEEIAPGVRYGIDTRDHW
ncbi:MAG: hypothetical protein FH748_13450 [Balneolaceae bacterium]|nr:hypothetical protein [Balneolaceae bacterium]